MTDTYWSNPKKYLKILDTYFRMYIKHLDLNEPYKTIIYGRIKSIWAELIDNKHAKYGDVIRMAKKMVEIDPSMDSAFLYLFSIFNMPKTYMKVKYRIARIIMKPKVWNQEQ